MDSDRKKAIIRQLKNQKTGKILNLAAEILSSTDIIWLLQIIKKSCYLEEIYLPAMEKNQLKMIIHKLNKLTKTNTTLTKIEFKLPDFPTGIPDNLFKMYHQIQSRLARNAKRIFGIHGGGNIGLGLMADIVAQSPFNYNIVGTTNNRLFRNLINTRHQFWLQQIKGKEVNRKAIENIEMVSREKAEIIKLYEEANILALCLTENVFCQVADLIAEGLINRYKKDGAGLKILILMNTPKCGQVVYNKIAEKIRKRVNDKTLANDIICATQFVPTVVDRIVTKCDEDEIRRDWYNQYVNDKQHINEREPIYLKPSLFKAEKDFLFYVPNTFAEAKRFPVMKPVKDIDVFATIKNKYINGPHAILGWLGALQGWNTIAESIKNPWNYKFIKSMMEDEIAPILKAQYPEITYKELESLKSMFLSRCLSSEEDSVIRVGRDPLRKLNKGERIRGTIELLQQQDLNVPASRLMTGIAFGILYALKGHDYLNGSCKKIRELYARNHDYNDILCYKGSYDNGSFSGFDQEKDRWIIKCITKQISIYDKLMLNHSPYYIKQMKN